MSFSWQEDPQKSVFPLGRDSSLIIIRRESPPHARTGRGRSPWQQLAPALRVVERAHLLLLQGFRRFAVSADPESAQRNFNLDLVGFNAGQFNADSKTGSALEHVDRRTPLNAGIMKIGEMDLSDLVGNLANLALEKSQAKCSDFSAHDPQWTRWPNEATIKSPDLKGRILRSISQSAFQL